MAAQLTSTNGPPPGAGAVDGAREEPLAGPGLALDEDQRQARSGGRKVDQPANLLPQG